MFEGDGADTNRSHFKGLFNDIEPKAGFASSLIPLFLPFTGKGVAKPSAKLRATYTICIQFYFSPAAKGAQIVQSMEVICVGVRQEHRIEPVDTRSKGLEPEFRPAIYQYGFSAVSPYVEGAAKAGVGGVC